MSDLSIAPVVCVRCGYVVTGQYQYLGALGPWCGRCFGEEAEANRAAYQAVPAYGAETDCEPRIRELEAELDLKDRHIQALQEDAAVRETWLKKAESDNRRLRTALAGLLDGLDDYWVTLPEGIAAVEAARATLEGEPAPQGSVEDIVQGIAGRNK